jgi:hypothetical protein
MGGGLRLIVVLIRETGCHASPAYTFDAADDDD